MFTQRLYVKNGSTFMLSYILVVCPCVCDDGHGRNEFAGRVQTIMCVSAFTEMAILIFLEIVKAAAGLDTLSCRLGEGCHCGRLPSH